MPTYQVEIPGMGTFQVEHDQELTDEQAVAAARASAGSQVQPQPQQQPIPNQPIQTPEPTDYIGSVGRRVNTGVNAFLNIPTNLKDIVTGEGEEGIVGPRLGSALKVLQGAALPATALLAPIGGGGEQLARLAGANDKWAQLIGDVTEGVGTLGLGVAANAGKLGNYAGQFAKVVGAGSGSRTLTEQLPHDPQLRFAVSQKPTTIVNPLEEMIRTPATMEELAMAMKQPGLAATFLQRRKAQMDNWVAWAKEGKVIDEVPDGVSFSPKQMLEFQPPSPGKDAGFFSTLGTPTNVAARTNPMAAQASYEMALAEMNMAKSIQARGDRTNKALEGLTDKDGRLAVLLREDPGAATKMGVKPDNPAYNLVNWMASKFEADKQTIIPRLRESWRERISGQVEREMKKTANAWGEEVDKLALANKVDEKVKKMIPDDWGVDDYLPHIFPGHYKVLDASGELVTTVKNKFAAKMFIRDEALAGKESSKYTVEARSYFDSDLLKFYQQGRVSRTMDSIAKNAALTAEEIADAAKGEIGRSGAKNKFFGSLVERQGKGSGYIKDFKEIMSVYDRGMERWTQLSDLSRKVAPLITELGQRNYSGVAHILEHSLERLWGYRSPVSQFFDNTLQAIPVVNKFVSPQFLEKVTGGLKTGIVHSFLTFNPRFHAVNSTQTLSTLWPIVGAGDMSEGVRLARSSAGKALLEQHLPPGSRVEGFGKSLGFSEKMNQNLSFLTMYNKARKWGLDDTQAGNYAKLRGNLYTQFLGLTSDVPHAFSKIDPLGIATLFQRFPVKQVELLGDVIRDKNFPAAAKWMATNFLLGGFKSASMGNAGWTTYKLFEQIKKDYGETTAELVHSGLPSLLGVDLSNSVMLYNPPFGESWAEKAGNLMGGVVGGLLSSVIGAVGKNDVPEANPMMRGANALVNRVPAFKQLAAIRRMWESDYDFKDPGGRLKYRGDFKEAVKQLLGARPMTESEIDTRIGAFMDIREKRDSVLNYVASRSGMAALSGIPLSADMQKAVQKEVDLYNAQWPEFPITGQDISTRAKARQQQSAQTLMERMRKSAPRGIRQNDVFQDPSVQIDPFNPQQ